MARTIIMSKINKALKFPNGTYDPWRLGMMIAGFVMVIILAITNIMTLDEHNPSFEFVESTAAAITPVVTPGEDLIIALKFKSKNEPGYTQIFGQFDCSEGYRVEAVQYRNFSLIAGGGEPFEAETEWSVKVPEGAPPGPCVYTHAAVLFNDSIQVVKSFFMVREVEK